MEYALIDLANNSIVERKSFDNPPADVSHKGIKWLPVTVIRPGCDLNFQIEQGPVITVTEHNVTIVYTVRNLTEEEYKQKRYNDINQNLFSANHYAGIGMLLIVNQWRASQNLSTLSQQEFVNSIMESMSPPETEENFIEYDKNGNPIN